MIATGLLENKIWLGCMESTAVSIYSDMIQSFGPPLKLDEKRDAYPGADAIQLSVEELQLPEGMMLKESTLRLLQLH